MKRKNKNRRIDMRNGTRKYMSEMGNKMGNVIRN